MIAAAPYDSVDSTIISSPFIIPVVLKPPPSTAPKYSYAMDAANQSANAAPEVAFSDAGLEPVTQIDRSQKFTTLYPPTSTPYYEGNNNSGQYNGANQEGKQQRICGLTPKLFWILIVFMAVIIAAAIGGGVGGGLASQKKNSSSPTPTGSSAASSSPSSSTSSTTASNTASPLLNSGCNGTDNTFYSPSNAADDSSPFTINNKTLSYRILCYTNIPDKKSFNNPQITTLGQLQNLQSLQECITACATMNYAIKNALGGDSASVPFESLCSGVVYSYQDYTAGKPINCDLNSGVRMNASRVSWTDGRGPETHTQVDSAVLDLGD